MTEHPFPTRQRGRAIEAGDPLERRCQGLRPDTHAHASPLPGLETSSANGLERAADGHGHASETSPGATMTGFFVLWKLPWKQRDWCFTAGSCE